MQVARLFHHCLKEGLQGLRHVFRGLPSNAVHPRGIDDWEVALLIVGTQIHKEVERLVNHPIRPARS